MGTELILLITILIIVMTMSLLYLIYNIFKSKLLFKSALKASYKSGFALVALIFLYTITFSLWNSSVMFKDKVIDSTDNLVAQTNFHQVTIDSDEEIIGDNPNVLINQNKWITELGPTMEEMYETSFNDWTNIENQILSQDESLQLPGDHIDMKNTFYYKEFLDIWMYQNEKYQGNDKQTLPYINFGYNEVATLDLVIPAKEEDGTSLNARAVRMNPKDVGVVAPIPDIDDYKDELPNKLLLKEGEIPDANDSSTGTDKDDPVEIAILKSFGTNQDYPIGSTLDSKVESKDFVGSPVEYSNIYGKITGYVEHASLTFFNASNISIMPDFTQQTIMAMPYNAFNIMAKNVSGIVYPKYEINITFSEEMKFLKDGGSVEDFGVTQNEDNQDEFIKVISSYFKNSPNVEFYGQPTNTAGDNQRALKYSTALDWNNLDNAFSSGIQLTFIWSEANVVVNRIMNSIFLTINMVFIFMVLRRKVMSQSKQIGTFKAIGYNSTEIASSFTINIFIVVIFGGFASILLAFPLVSWFEALYLKTTLATELIGTQAGFSVALTSIILPLILISLAVWIFVGLILKKPVTSLLNDTTSNKPNFLVRSSTVITRHLSFTTAYATKNGIRAVGKSLVTFTAIFFSTTLLLFGVLVSGFADKASDSTLGLMNYETQSYASDKVVSLEKEAIDTYGGSDYNNVDNAYNFGVYFDYDSYSSATNQDAYHRDIANTNTNVWNDIFPSGYNQTNLEHRFKAWQQDAVYYMRDTEVFRNQSYVDVLDREFFDSYSNTTWLYYNLLTSDDPNLKKLATQKLEYKITPIDGAGTNQEIKTQEFNNLTLERVFLTMSMFFVESFDIATFTNNKIIFDIYETPAEEETLFKSTLLELNKINGVQQVPADNEKLEEIDLFSGSNISYEKSTFNLNSWLKDDDLNKFLLEYQNDDPNVLPVIIDYPTAKLYSVEQGDNIELVLPYDNGQDIIKPPTLELKVIAIYETYFSLPWFALNEEPALIKYLEEVDMYITNTDNTDDMWYANSTDISIGDVNNREFQQIEQVNKKSYSCMSSGSFYKESFFFVGSGQDETSTIENQQGYNNPIASMAPCFSIEVPSEFYLAISEEGTNMMNESLGIFVGFAYMIVFIILLVVSNETIQGSKREVSTLKALGYKTKTMSKIVLLGQSLIMIVSIFVAMPFTMLVLNLITTLLLKRAGMFFDLTPNFADLAIVIGVVVAIIVAMYILGVIVYKYTSSLDSLQRDA